MKRILYFAFFMLVTLCGQSQTINQKGVTYRYNGKNKRTPIGGVYIKAVTANNGVVSDENNGTFNLTLNSLQMGSRIGNVRVTKQGMMVFNQQAVDEWNVRKDPLCLILCNADEFQRQKKNLIAIGERQAQKKYEKKLAELNKLNDAKQLKIDEYYNKLDSLEKEKENALKHMDEYADVFARIDESEVDTVAQRAIELFHRGEIEESLRLLEGQHYMEKIGKALRTIQKADAMISTAEQAKSLAEQDKEKYLEGVRTQIAGYKLQNEWDKAAALLKGLADTLQTKEAIQEYAYFALNQKMYKEAETYYLKYKGILEHLSQSNPQAYEPDLADSYNNLAVLYSDTQRFAESEAMHKQALAIRERLAKSNTQAYEPALAMSYNNLANLYYKTQRFADSEERYKQALAIYERLAQSNPQAYEPDLAVSYNNLASLHSDTQRFSDSEAMHKQALEIYERLAQSNPQIFETRLMESFYWLGRTLLLEEKIHEAQEPFGKSLHLARKLVKAGTETSIYWESLYCLSFISANEKDYASAYTYNEELLPLMKAMYQKDKEGWKTSYSSQLVSQSFYANLLGKFKEGEQYSLEVLKVDSTQHIAYTNLAAALLFQGKVEKAENLFRQYKAEFKDGFLDYFAEFERLNVIPEERKKDVERVKSMLKE